MLRGVWRASSLVECVNSVARMQQARHRKMTQGLLDLKRLYWNLRRFRTGHRKGQTPYGLLGLKLPELSFWEFLKLTPEELREQLSAQEVAPSNAGEPGRARDAIPCSRWFWIASIQVWQMADTWPVTSPPMGSSSGPA